jgi:hypothetical protein
MPAMKSKGGVKFSKGGKVYKTKKGDKKKK